MATHPETYPDDDGNVPVSAFAAMPTHDEHHSKMVAEIMHLRPDAKAVLFIVENDGKDDDGEDGMKFIINSFGVNDEWVGILGLLGAAQAYIMSSMFTTPPGEEEEEPNVGSLDTDDDGA